MTRCQHMMRMNVIFSIVMFALAAMNITLGVLGGKMFSLAIGVFNLCMGLFFIHMYFKWKQLRGLESAVEQLEASHIRAEMSRLAAREAIARAIGIENTTQARTVAAANAAVAQERRASVEQVKTEEKPAEEAPIKPPEGKLDFNIDPADIDDDKIMRL